MEVRCFNGSYNTRMHKSYSVSKEVELDNKPNETCKGASFIKLLGPDFSNQLQIPREFTTIFNGCIPHRFIIESEMTNKCWRVAAKEEGDGTVYFRNGWSEFAEAHMLQVGDFLLFEYEEQPIFNVTIYDQNGCQKTFEIDRGGKHNPERITDVEELEENRVLGFEPKTVETSPPEQQKTSRLSKMKYVKRKSKKKNGKRTVTTMVYRIGNNIAFSVKIHKCKTHQFTQLTLPKAISLQKNLMKKDEMTLENTMGDRWLVKLFHRKDSRTIMSSGWKSFFEENQVAPGDTLEFEFVSDNLAQVRVLKKNSQFEQNSEDTTSLNGEDKSQDTDGEVDELDACTTDVTPIKTPTGTKRGRKRGSSDLSGSSFTFVWRPATQGFYLHIPKYVTESHNLRNEDKVVVRDPDGKCWPLEVSRRRDGRMALTKGWVEFWKGHNIKPGDVLHFTFVSDYLVQVNITRGEPLNSPNNNSIKEDTVNLYISDDDEPATLPESVFMPEC